MICVVIFLFVLESKFELYVASITFRGIILFLICFTIIIHSLHIIFKIILKKLRVWFRISIVVFVTVCVCCLTISIQALTHSDVNFYTLKIYNSSELKYELVAKEWKSFVGRSGKIYIKLNPMLLKEISMAGYGNERNYSPVGTNNYFAEYDMKNKTITLYLVFEDGSEYATLEFSVPD